MRICTRLSVVSLCLFAGFLVRCGGDGESEGSLCGGALPPIIYDGAASDEAVERVWDKRCVAQDHPGAATLVSPAGPVSAGTAPLLSWEQTIAAAPRPAAGGGSRGFSFPSLAFGIETARAHLPPVTGWVYLVELRPQSGSSVWLFTDQKSWRPDPVSWQHLSKSATISVRITSAYLNQNVVEDGPWLGAERSFAVGGN